MNQFLVPCYNAVRKKLFVAIRTDFMDCEAQCTEIFHAPNVIYLSLSYKESFSVIAGFIYILFHTSADCFVCSR